MRLKPGLVLLGLALALLLLWAVGGIDQLAWWAQGQQRALQSALGGALARLRAAEPGALWGLIAICAAYGFLHALGPGHGKLLIAGAAAATRATGRRMSLIALAGSLGQAGLAIVLVYGGFALFDATARSLTANSEQWLSAAGNLALAGIGGWLLLRGLRVFGPRRATAGAHAHGPGCGHVHGPSPQQAADADSPAAAALVLAIAARPCTGALFVLVIAWSMGLAAAGAAAVLAMGLGTAAFTILVAVVAVMGRDAAFLSAGGGRAAKLLGPAVQVVVGSALLIVGFGLALPGPPL